ncbi:MAG TPA: hypothetical protein VMZ04_02575, partial [Anaerolineae bacterium]|nr:hypothetical protein [Anaerolineae bacterium]
MIFDGSDRWDSCLYDRNIDVDTQPGSARLLKTELIADEMGNSTDATRERMGGSLRAKKEFYITDPSADAATLLIYNDTFGTNNTTLFQALKSTMIIEVNGQKNTVTFDPKRNLTGGWSRADIDPKQLRKGLNTFVIYPANNDSINLYIDNCLYPNRSAKSLDGGKTWDYNHLG